MLGSLRKFFRAYSDFDQSARDKFVAKSISEINSGSSLLDLGAGGGPYKDLVVDHDIEYTSQDFGQLPIELLREGDYSPIDVVCDAASIPLKDGIFDACLCTEVLEHVPDSYAVVSEISRLLKEDGVAIITVPRISAAHQLPYCFVSGFHEAWVEELARRYNFIITYCGYPHGGPMNLAKLALAQSAYNVSLLDKKGRLAALIGLLALPFSLLSLVSTSVAAAMIDRFDTTPTYSYGLHIVLRKKNQVK